MSMNYYRQRIVLILVCLLFVVVLPSCTAAEVESQAGVEADVVETMGNEELSNTTIAEEVEAETFEADSSENSLNSIVSASEWPMADCIFDTRMLSPEFTESETVSLSTPEIVYTLPIISYFQEWLPDTNKFLVSIPSAEEMSIGAVDVMDSTFTPYVGSQNGAQVIWDEEQRSIIYTDRQDGIYEIRKAHIDTDENAFQSELLVEDVQVESISWNLIDRSIVFGTKDNNAVLRIETSPLARSQPIRNVFQLPSNDVIRLSSWSKDGRYLATSTNNAEMYLFDAKTQSICHFALYAAENTLNSSTAHESVYGQSIRDISWSPDGTQLLIIASFSEGSIHANGSAIPIIIDLDSKVLSVIVPDRSDIATHAIQDVSWSPSHNYIAFMFPDDGAQTKLHLYDVDKQHFVASSSDTSRIGFEFSSLIWSYDGSKIAHICRDDDPSAPRHICVATVSGLDK